MKHINMTGQIKPRKCSCLRWTVLFILLIISSLALTALLVLRKPEFGKERARPTNMTITPPLKLLDLTTNYVANFNAPFQGWLFNHALIDISFQNIEITVHLVDDNDYPVPNFIVTGETGPLHFEASSNKTIERMFRGSLNFTILSIRKSFLSGIFRQCSKNPLLKAGFKARISMFPLSALGIYPVSTGLATTECPDFATSGILSIKGGVGNGTEENPQFPRLAALSGLARNFLSRNQTDNARGQTSNGNIVQPSKPTALNGNIDTRTEASLVKNLTGNVISVSSQTNQANTKAVTVEVSNPQIKNNTQLIPTQPVL